MDSRSITGALIQLRDDLKAWVSNCLSTKIDITDTVQVSAGGTGAKNAKDALANLGAMDLETDQTVKGVKTFSDGIKLGEATVNYDKSKNRIAITFDTTE